MTSIDKSVQVLVASMIGALVVYFVGDAIVYEDGADSEVGFEEGSPTAEVINVAPLLLVALGLYGAFQYM